MRAKPITAFSVRKTASKERSVVVMATDRSDAPEEGFVASTDGPTLGGFALPSAKSMALAVTGVTAAFVAQPMHILQMAFAGNGGDGASGGGDGGDGNGGNGWGVPAAYASLRVGVHPHLPLQESQGRTTKESSARTRMVSSTRIRVSGAQATSGPKRARPKRTQASRHCAEH